MKVRLAFLLLSLCVNHSAFGLECYCNSRPGINPMCGGLIDFTESCELSGGICLTTHVRIFLSGSVRVRVKAECLDKTLNPDWEEKCSGSKNTENRIFQCCDTPQCNKAFFDAPFPTLPPPVTDSLTSNSSGSGQDDSSGMGGLFAVTTDEKDTKDQKGSSATTTTTKAEKLATTKPTAAAPSTFPFQGSDRESDRNPGEVATVVVAVCLSVVGVVIVLMVVVFIVTHLKWNKHSKGVDSEENSEAELQRTSPIPPSQKLKLKGQQAVVAASTAQVHPQPVHNKPGLETTGVAGQTAMMPSAIESIACWDSDGKGS